MFARRQTLLRQLELSKDAEEVLDIVVALLFQQVKNVAAFGSSLNNPNLLKILSGERKISEEVATSLTELASAVRKGHSGNGLDVALIETVRRCGLAKDISKHQTS